jgi:hypothetical protein
VEGEEEVRVGSEGRKDGGSEPMGPEERCGVLRRLLARWTG